MFIKSLDENVISLIRSSSSIDSVTQCVTELVLNSLDAKANAIAVRVNLSNFRIQVVDNGKGVSRQNLELVGQRYMTNKCHSLPDLQKNLKYYGFKGEALANLVEISQRVCLTSREKNSNETFCKTLEEGAPAQIEAARNRPSFGTTVTIDGFLSRVPVRQQCLKSCELDQVKKSLESLVIIHPRVSFSLRNDSNGNLILNSIKTPDITTSFKTIHQEIDDNNFAFLKVSKNRISVEGLIHRELHDSNRLQYIYVNKRPITCTKIQNFINCFVKNHSRDKTGRQKNCPIFVLHIKCPYSHVDLTLEPSKTVVYFKRFETVRRCIEKLFNVFYCGSENVKNEKIDRQKVRSEFGLSLIGGAVKGVGVKRKSEDFQAPPMAKSPRIINETPDVEVPKILAKETMRAALPIEVVKSAKPLNCCLGDELQGGNTTFHTNFPENEEKGKGVIMDMFIKSVRIFPSQNETLGNPSVGGITQNDELETVPEKARNMVSVGVQAGSSGLSTNEPPHEHVADYNFDFSKIQSFKFHQNFAQTKKLFNFKNKQPIFNDYDCSHDCRLYKSKSEDLSPRGEKVQNRQVNQSPYFLNKMNYFKKPQKPETVGAFALLVNEPKRQFETSFTGKDLEVTFSTRKKGQKVFDESTISKYFSPEKLSNFDYSRDLFTLTTTRKNTDYLGNNLVITTSGKTKEKILKNGLKFENILTASMPTTANLNKDMSFEIVERFDFVPKGFSPILKSVDVEALSSEGKENLRAAVIESYEDELLLIKWQNYIEHKDPKKFFEEIYLEKSKLIENAIPNANAKQIDHLRFTKKLFDNVEIVGQVDCKFIAVLERTKNMILLFDQHAVHERVRLEELSKNYKNSSTKLNQDIMIFLPHHDLSLLKHQKRGLKALGLVLDFFADAINIHQVPLCVYNKSKKGYNLVELVETLIKELIETLRSNNGIIVNAPKLVQNIVNSEACRGAIKFGDSLTRTECFTHLRNLARCDLPFQCAHGRPTLTPLISLNKFIKIPATKPRWSNLKTL